MKKNHILISVLFLLGIVPANAQYSNIHNFNDTAGSFPSASLTLAGGVLWGTTGTGGANGGGCIFSLNTNGSGFQDRHDFSGNPTDGDNPYGSLALVGNMLYGMCWNGGTGGSTTDGCIFSINTDGSNYMVRFNFGGQNLGFSPYGSLIFSDSLLYGMAGGGPDAGVVFSVDTDGSGYDTVMAFYGANGATPYGSLTLSGGVLYGMTSKGGANNSGCIFSVNTNGTGYSDMHDFSNGSNPYGSLTLQGSMLYGMTEYGGLYSQGNIFSINTNGTGYTDRFDFNDTLGAQPQGDLTLARNVMYGMTQTGGLYGGGNVFEVDTDGTGFNVLLSFNGANGLAPEGDLILSGNVLYGMAYGGGADSDGVIFKLDTNTATAINEINVATGSVNLYPNPNNGRLTIALTMPEAISVTQPHVEIYNVLGELVYQSNITVGNSQISLPNAAAGIYLYRLVTHDGKLVGEGKFVVQ